MCSLEVFRGEELAKGTRCGQQGRGSARADPQGDCEPLEPGGQVGGTSIWVGATDGRGLQHGGGQEE